MSPEAQRVAILKACGWTQNDPPFGDLWYHQDHPRCQDGRYCDLEEAPDYPTDLNAMHEAEKALTTTQLIRYGIILTSVAKNPPDKAGEDFDYKVTCATAAQRAEAFLRTLNLWQPNPTPK